jgi:hypothetical protein
MKTTEIALWIIFLAGLLLVSLNLQMFGILIIISLLLLGILYYFLGFALFNNIPLMGIFKRSSYSGLSINRIMGAIAAGLVISDVCIGILFRIEHWPMSNYMLIVGTIASILVLIVAVIKYLRLKDKFYLPIILRLVAIIIPGILLYFF